VEHWLTLQHLASDHCTCIFYTGSCCRTGYAQESRPTHQSMSYFKPWWQYKCSNQ